MKTLAVLGLAIIFWLAGMNGNLGSILAAFIDPASLVDGSNPDTTTGGTGTSAALPTPPPVTTPTKKVDLNAWQKDTAQLNQDLLGGLLTSDITSSTNNPGNLFTAQNASFAVQQDVNRNASRAQLQKDLLALQQILTVINNPTYNADYKKIYADLGF